MIWQILTILAAVWVLCVCAVVLCLWRTTSIEAPVPDSTPAQVIWMRAAAKVAHRRTA